MQANSGDHDQTPHSVASDLGFYCKHMSHKKDFGFASVNITVLGLTNSDVNLKRMHQLFNGE